MTRRSGDQAGRHWTVVLPFFNETGYLPRTLESLAAQELSGFRLILVDNASTDGSAALAREVMARHPAIETIHLFESLPGKVHALATGLESVTTPFVAFCDADTYYPPHYLKRGDALFAGGGEALAAVMAMDLPEDTGSPAAHRKRTKVMTVACLWPRQVHTGGFGQCFRSETLRRAGGFSAALWPFVLEDHEVMQRVFKLGGARYAADLWCVPSNRRKDRARVGWTLTEQLLYHATPFALKDWFFYRFLKGRFTARGLANARLREKTWPD